MGGGLMGMGGGAGDEALVTGEEAGEGGVGSDGGRIGRGVSSGAVNQRKAGEGGDQGEAEKGVHKR